MFCRNCGAEIGNARFCPNCGALQGEQAPAQNTPPYQQPYHPYQPYPPQQQAYQAPYRQAAPMQGSSDRMAPLFRDLCRDPLFLTAAILVTLQAVLTAVSSYVSGRELSNATPASLLISAFGSILVPALFAIALWILYGAGRGGQTPFPSGGLSLISGTLLFIIILGWIMIGLVIMAAILLLVLGTAFWSAIQSGVLSSFDPELLGPMEDLLGVSSLASTTVLGVVFGLFLVIAAVAALLLIFYYGTLHRFAKSLSLSARSGQNQMQSVSGAKTWLIVVAVLTLIGVCYDLILQRSDVLGLLSSLCRGVSMILCSVLIGKHLMGRRM